ncbi:MAG: cache domain-containing protein [Candidatus Rifleibacteriota bacterium]
MQSQFLASVVVHFLQTSQAHLNSVARVPATNIFASGSTLKAGLIAKQRKLTGLIEASQFFIGLAYEKFLSLRKNMIYWSELPAAAIRRALYEFMFIEFELEDDSPRGLLLSGMTADDGDVLRISEKVSFARKITGTAVEYVQILFEPLVEFARFFDNLIGLKREDFSLARNQFEVFLSKALSRKSFFRSVSLYDRSGIRQSFYSIEGEPAPVENIDMICRYLAKNKINWWGKIRFEQKLDRNFVNLASVVRDKDRKPAGFVLAELDLAPVSVWLKDFSGLVGKKTLISDGNIVFHNSEMEPSSEICSKLVRAVMDKFEGSYESRYYNGADGWNIFCRPLTSFYNADLPAWKLCVIEKKRETNHVISAISIILVIVLAVVAFYVLFYRFRKSES